MSKRLIFISHSGRDAWVARQIAVAIGNVGAETFLDEEQVAIGSNFEDEIRRFLVRADELLVLLTPWALDRPYVWAELGAAWILRIPIVVVLHGLTPSEVQAHPRATVFLKERNMIEINDIEDYIAELRVRVIADGAGKEGGIVA